MAPPGAISGSRARGFGIRLCLQESQRVEDLHAQGNMMRTMTSFDALREHSRITWIEQEHGWAATAEDIVTVLSRGLRGMQA
jgi:hypothetical protein